MIKFDWINENNYNECFYIRQKLFDYNFNGNIYEKIIKKEDMDAYFDINYAIILNEKNDKIGTIGYYISKENPERCWIGWYGILSIYRGKGYGDEILNTYIDYIKNNIKNAKFLNVYTDFDECKGAINGYNKIGMEIEKDKFYEDSHSKRWCILGVSLDNNKYIKWNKEPLWCED